MPAQGTGPLDPHFFSPSCVCGDPKLGLLCWGWVFTAGCKPESPARAWDPGFLGCPYSSLRSQHALSSLCFQSHTSHSSLPLLAGPLAKGAPRWPSLPLPFPTSLPLMLHHALLGKLVSLMTCSFNTSKRCRPEPTSK
jgi:hypothetical protein